MRVAELFHSIQGEGTLVGVPSVFIRTSGCNLRCRWCDTPDTSWKPEGDEMSVAEILEYVSSQPSSHVVVTGGEPMIAPEIGALTGGLRKLGRHITIETAGTVLAEVACDLMSISPKLANSTPDKEQYPAWSARHEANRIQRDVLRKLMRVCSYQLKFVIADPNDLDEVRRLVSDIEAPTDRIILMAEGTEPAVLSQRGQWLAEICLAEGFRFSPRLHIDLWGNRRGV